MERRMEGGWKREGKEGDEEVVAMQERERSNHSHDKPPAHEN